MRFQPELVVSRLPPHVRTSFFENLHQAAGTRQVIEGTFSDK